MPLTFVQTPFGDTIIKGTNTPENHCYLLQFDGLCIPNPGVATAGAILWSPGVPRTVAIKRGEFIGQGTNNIAEYTGLLIGVQAAADFGVKNILIQGDSALVIQQVIGNWKVNNEALRVIHTEIRRILLDRFDFVALKHVVRALNVDADQITNDVYKTKKSFYKVV